MTVNAETAKSGPYTGNGSTVVHAYAFKVLDQAHIVVTQTVTATGVETVKTLTTHYTVSGVGSDGGGNVTMVTAAESTDTITITRAVPQTQTTDLVNRAAVVPSTVETAIDRGVQMVQDFDEEMGRAIKLPVSTNMGSVSSLLPAPSANGYLLWDSAGTALTTSTTAASQSLGNDGTVLLPFYSFLADPNSGLFRVGADQLGWSVNGVKGLDLSTTGLTVTGTLAATAITGSGILSIDDTTESTSGTTGSIHTDGGLGIAKKLHVIGTTTHGGDVLSDTDSTDSLGSTGVRWLKLWVDSIQTTANTDIAGNLTVTGNLTINGTTVTNDATNTEIKDPLIELNSGAGSNANDLGFIFERGSTGNNGFLGWDESGDYFVAATTTATGASTGNITYSFAPFKCSAITATSGTLAGITSLGLSAGATITAGILDEDAMGSNSAVALATQQSIKAYTDNNAPENGVKFAFETTTTDTDQGAGKVWLNNGTPSSATVLYVDDVEAGSVSVNAWVDTFDDVANAVARGYIYIASYGTTNAILVYKVTGAVTSASTYSKIAVTHVLTVGTISDGDSIGLTFVPSGVDGDLSDPTTTRGDILSRGASSVGRLAVGSANTVLQSDGTDPAWSSNLTVSGTATAGGNLLSQVGTQTIWMPVAAMRPTSSNGCAAITDVETTSGRPDLQVLDFDASSDEHAQFQIGFPKSWNEGTVTFRVFWTSTATDTDGVAWGLQGVSVANDATIDVAYGTAVVVTDDNISAAEDCLVTATSSAVTIASVAADTLTFFRIFRDISDGNDDMTEDARLIGVQIFFTTNAVNDA
jgi:hypothetical protein